MFALDNVRGREHYPLTMTARRYTFEVEAPGTPLHGESFDVLAPSDALARVHAREQFAAFFAHRLPAGAGVVLRATALDDESDDLSLTA